MLSKLERWWRHVRAQGQLTIQARELMKTLGDPTADRVKNDEIKTLIMQIGVAHLQGLQSLGWRYDPTQHKEKYH